MIVYKSSAREFCEAVDSNQLVPLLENAFRSQLGRSLPPSELSAYVNSLPLMERVIRRSGVADDCGILIEYKVPLTNSRIDFIIAGQDTHGKDNFVIVELKQWQHATAADGDNLVETFTGHSNRIVQHPSAQAQDYKTFITDFNENVANDMVSAYSCAYLHNYQEAAMDEPLRDVKYADVIGQSPIFFRDDQSKLEAYFATYVKNGNGMHVIDEIETGKIKPSKRLVDYVSSIMHGNKEYTLLDEQRIVFERVKAIASSAHQKTVIIIQGGPGTGKSVVAVNLLSDLLQDNLNTAFVAPNASFRNTIVKRLAERREPRRLQNLFKSSGSFYESPKNEFDILIVDEAHRLKNQMAYMYKGYNQVQDIINASLVNIFFIDDNQRVRPEDIGSISEITRVAEEHNASLHTFKLGAQFRCAGAEGYVQWVDDALQIHETANSNGWETEDFEFKIFDNPHDLHAAIKNKDSSGHSARLLAGYAWRWSAAKDGNSNAQVEDITIPEYDFSMPWNSRKVGTTWAIDPSGVDQIGCIHTSQGLEFEYVGVILGNDLHFNNSTYSFETDYKQYLDANGKKGLKNDPDELNRLVRNIYKVLMTRGMRGCYVYFCDKDTEAYFRERLQPKPSLAVSQVAG